MSDSTQGLKSGTTVDDGSWKRNQTPSAERNVEKHVPDWARLEADEYMAHA